MNTKNRKNKVIANHFSIAKEGRLKRFNQSGVTLVELMISLTISLIVVTGLVEIYISNKQTYRVQTAMSQVQETGRTAIDWLAREIRMGGYRGCSVNFPRFTPDIQADSNLPGMDSWLASFQPMDIVGGHHFDGSSWSPVWPNSRLSSANAVKANTDVLTISRASSCSAKVIQEALETTTTIVIDGNPCGFKEDDYLIISDCGGSDIFKASSVYSASGETTITSGGGLWRAYDVDAQVMRLLSTDYYISENAVGTPLLMAQSMDGTVEPLFEGVEDLALRFGTSAPGLDQGAVYNAPASITDWSYVNSIKLELLMRTTSNNIASERVPYTFDGQTIVAEDMPLTDRYLRKTYASTIQVRKRN